MCEWSAHRCVYEIQHEQATGGSHQRNVDQHFRIFDRDFGEWVKKLGGMIGMHGCLAERGTS